MRKVALDRRPHRIDGGASRLDPLFLGRIDAARGLSCEARANSRASSTFGTRASVPRVSNTRFVPTRSCIPTISRRYRSRTARTPTTCDPSEQLGPSAAARAY